MRYEALLEFARDMIFFVADDGRIIEVNAAAIETYGYSREEFRALSIADMREPGTRGEALKTLAASLQRSVLFEAMHARKDGSVFPVEISARPVKGDEGSVVLCILRDVSERKRVEAELQRARQELEDRVRARTAELAAANAELEVRVEELSFAQQLITEQARAISELSTPVIELWDALLVAPIVGDLDDRRAAQLTERLLARVAETRAAVALLDLTGVARVDAATARSLLGAVAAVRLLGAAVILTGVRPAIAQALVSLGVDLGGVEIRVTLADGLRAAFARRGMHVTARR